MLTSKQKNLLFFAHCKISINISIVLRIFFIEIRTVIVRWIWANRKKTPTVSTLFGLMEHDAGIEPV